MQANQELLTTSSGFQELVGRSERAAADAVAGANLAKKREQEALMLRKMAFGQLKVGSLNLAVSSCAAWQ